jgi:hypothetical protein
MSKIHSQRPETAFDFNAIVSGLKLIVYSVNFPNFFNDSWLTILGSKFKKLSTFRLAIYYLIFDQLRSSWGNKRIDIASNN